jgi:hypothetical protein
VPVSKNFFTHCSEPRKKTRSPDRTKSHLSQVPGKGYPNHVPPNGAPMVRDVPSSEPIVYSFIHSYISESPFKEPSHETGEIYGHRPSSPTRTEGLYKYVQWSAAWFPKGIVCDTDITSSVPCSLQHDTFHLGLGRTQACYPACVIVTLYRCPLRTC